MAEPDLETPSALAAGLYLVSTPIGRSRDITLTALGVLRDASVLAAEDTRRLRKLLDIHGIELRGRPIWPYHDHSTDRDRAKILNAIESGASVAYASDAGTPMVADPGYALVRDAAAKGVLVTTAPGVSSAIVALTLSGLPTDRFFFAGFAPRTATARKKFARMIAEIPGTVVFFETARRIEEVLTVLLEELGEDRPVALCRELTKKFEDVRRMPLAELIQSVATDPPRGEIVMVIGEGEEKQADPADVDAALLDALETMKVKDASRAVADKFGMPRKTLYARALELRSADE